MNQDGVEIIFTTHSAQIADMKFGLRVLKRVTMKGHMPCLLRIDSSKAREPDEIGSRIH